MEPSQYDEYNGEEQEERASHTMPTLGPMTGPHQSSSCLYAWATLAIHYTQ